ncbi:hypothetical protein A3731_08465 [Roseovarius sp. HI0049]|nr:hypothetical protein A3731_08465 [Roseovarius sp. HI0049]
MPFGDPANLDSRLSGQDDISVQPTETETPETFDKWVGHWNDLVDFGIVELNKKPTGSIHV